MLKETLSGTTSSGQLMCDYAGPVGTSKMPSYLLRATVTYRESVPANVPVDALIRGGEANGGSYSKISGLGYEAYRTLGGVTVASTKNKYFIMVSGMIGVEEAAETEVAKIVNANLDKY